MTLRYVVAAAALGLALAGCGTEDGASPPQTGESSTTVEESSAPPAAVASDEQQIRDLIAAQTDAIAAGDWTALAELTCAKYREQARDPGANLVPPISQFGPPEQVSTLDPAMVADQLGQQFGGGASPETLDRVAQAIVDYDEQAYQDGMLDLLTQSLTLTVDSVDNIQITGDTAAADVTATRTMGDNPPQTSTENTPYVREGGQWLDCADPSGGA
ncbi:MAG: hypothetical protein SW019_15335 [Actinomycetota bacterium]|nr:hypothetical protein [Actinomycetota bacterium]